MSSEDTHVVAGVLKTFLRDLHEPLLTYELYDEIIQFLGILFVSLIKSLSLIKNNYRLAKRGTIAKCEINSSRETSR